MRPTKDWKVYEYISVYVDDFNIAKRNPAQFCEELKKKYKFKLKGDGPLECHLGCVYKQDPDGTLVADPRRYISKILDSNERMFSLWPKKTRTPLEAADHPELDMTELWDDKEIK